MVAATFLMDARSRTAKSAYCEDHHAEPLRNFLGGREGGGGGGEEEEGEEEEGEEEEVEDQDVLAEEISRSRAIATGLVSSSAAVARETSVDSIVSVG
jgi:hypothetical protein